jgi:hypothetical protein
MIGHMLYMNQLIRLISILTSVFILNSMSCATFFVGSQVYLSTQSLSIDFSSEVISDIRFGMTGIILKDNNDALSSQVMADLSAEYHVSPDIQLGFVARNVIGVARFGDSDASFDFGLSHSEDNVGLDLGYTYVPNLSRGAMNSEVSYNGFSFMDISVGYSGVLSQLSFGVVTLFEGIRVDYTYSQAAVGPLHRFGFGFVF